MSNAAFMRSLQKGGNIDPEAFLKAQKEKKTAVSGAATPPTPSVPTAPEPPAEEPKEEPKKPEIKRIEKKVRTLPPAVKAGDSDQVISLKRDIMRQEEEIQELLLKLNEYNSRLEKIVLYLDPEKMDDLTAG
mmetsp:Transcript_20214/g.34856  ORF Transcript_20214/g.34856 Transcript_20214/m.34856 type:complete len:132 (-) Transcript_20214:394-789(-)